MGGLSEGALLMPDQPQGITLKYELDKILILLLLFLVGGSVCWMVHQRVDKEIVTWWMRTFDNLTGAFLTLLSGSAGKIMQEIRKGMSVSAKVPD